MFDQSDWTDDDMKSFAEYVAHRFMHYRVVLVQSLGLNFGAPVVAVAPANPDDEDDNAIVSLLCRLPAPVLSFYRADGREPEDKVFYVRCFGDMDEAHRLDDTLYAAFLLDKGAGESRFKLPQFDDILEACNHVSF